MVYLSSQSEGLTTINRVKENINKTVFAYLRKSTWVDIITSIIKGTLAQWLEHHIMILKVVIVKVTGSNPVCASSINKLTYKQHEKDINSNSMYTNHSVHNIL